MDRNEVLAALSRAEVDYVRVQSETKTVWEFQEAEWKAKALRAAAEIIRASGWRPIVEAPEKKQLLVGEWVDEYWDTSLVYEKEVGIYCGYTHYLPEPEPPAREVPNDGE